MKALSETKAAMRRLHLHELRQSAKDNPSKLHAESVQLCEILHDSIYSLRSRLSVPLLVCGYLPLYYEIDLRPLFRRLWHGTSPLRVFVPVVQIPTAVSASVSASRLASAMFFLEVLHEKDLQCAFAPSGRYGLMEPKEEVLLDFMDGHSSRGCVACEDWTALFPDRVRPPGLLELRHTPTCLLVLTPGVVFGQSGARLGKGGGYYDRFLRHQRREVAQSAGSGAEVLAWGIARESQLVQTDPPNQSGNDSIRDERVNAIATPERFVVCGD